jgi:hypothetical protein
MVTLTANLGEGRRQVSTMPFESDFARSNTDRNGPLPLMLQRTISKKRAFGAFGASTASVVGDALHCAYLQLLMIGSVLARNSLPSRRSCETRDACAFTAIFVQESGRLRERRPVLVNQPAL